MDLPLWFLVLSLFVPRISLLIGYFEALPSFVLTGWVSFALAVLIPRALVLILIFQDRGMSGWLFVHAAAMALVYSSAGRRSGKTMEYRRWGPN